MSLNRRASARAARGAAANRPAGPDPRSAICRVAWALSEVEPDPKRTHERPRAERPSARIPLRHGAEPSSPSRRGLACARPPHDAMRDDRDHGQHLDRTRPPTSATAAASSTCSATPPRPQHARALGVRTNAGADALDEGSGGGVGWSTAPQKIRVQHRVRQLQNPLERRDFRFRQLAARNRRKPTATRRARASRACIANAAARS